MDKHPVQLALDLAVAGQREAHDARHRKRKQRDQRQEDQRGPGVHGEGHHHRAQHHEGRAQKQAQRHVHARLHLVHVGGHAVDERSGAQGIQLGVGQPLDVPKERAFELRGKPHRRLGGKKLRGDGADKAQQPQPHQSKAHAQHVARVARLDAVVDDGRHDEGHKQLQHRFQKLEQRGEHAFLAVGV